MNSPDRPAFLALSPDQIAIFATEQAERLALIVPAPHRAVVVENLLALQAHARLVDSALAALNDAGDQGVRA